MSARRVLLLRHGQTAYNAEDRFQGQTDIPLDDLGVDQAKRAAERLGAILESTIADDVSPRLVASDLSRAVATAQPLAERLGLVVETDPRLREVFAGEWEGLKRQEIIARWPDDFAAWRRGDPDLHLGGHGESRRETAARAAAAITDHAGLTGADRTGAVGTLVVVGHGGALRGAILQLIGMPGFPWNALEGLRNAHWAELHPTSGGAVTWRLSSYNVS